jgi:hypothetical protein
MIGPEKHPEAHQIFLFAQTSAQVFRPATPTDILFK